MPRKVDSTSKDTVSTAERRRRSVRRGRKPKAASTGKKKTAKVSASTKSKVKAVARKVKAVAKTVKRRIRKKVLPANEALDGLQSKDILIGAPAVQVVSSIDDVLLSPQERIEDAKYYIAEHEQDKGIELEDIRELPQYYGDNKVVLMVRDPWWIFSYWELQPGFVEEKRHIIPPDKRQDASFVMRVYDISYIDFNGTNAHYFFDITIPYGAEKWYINVNAPGRTWIAEMGWVSRDGSFYPIIRSNAVSTPLDGPSWITDEEWAVPEELFSKLYGLSIGFGGLGAGLSSAEMHQLWSQQLFSAAGSGAVSSWGGSEQLASIHGPQQGQKARKFWMVVNTELIVYGATEPDAKVSVQGVPIKLRPDGTFSLRFALPDGMQVIPVKGISADGVDEIVITPVVQKETR